MLLVAILGIDGSTPVTEPPFCKGDIEPANSL